MGWEAETSLMGDRDRVLYSLDGSRLERLIAAFNRVGRQPDDGWYRPGYSELESEAMAIAATEMRAAGLEIAWDPALNLFGHPADSQVVGRSQGDGAPVVYSGSHLDTVPGGGAYDGVLGVVCALEAVRLLQGSGREAPDRDVSESKERDADATGVRPPVPRAPDPTSPGSKAPRPNDRFGVVVWRSEESSRFGVGCIGSRLTTGGLSFEDLKRLRDRDGVSAYDALRALGGVPEKARRPDRLAGQMAAFIEVHVDQSSFLHDAGCPIGVVTRIISPAKVWVTFHGVAEHAGAATPSKRRDALRGASALMTEVYELSAGLPEDQVRLTVGAVQVTPNAVNVVPSSAKIGIDLRCASNDERDRIIEEISQRTSAVSERFGLEGSVDVLTRGGAFDCPPHLIDVIEQAAHSLGVPICRMVSFAGHDARVVGDVVPAAMILVANPAGVSHTPEEAVDIDAAVAATRVLAAAMDALAAASARPPNGSGGSS